MKPKDFVQYPDGSVFLRNLKKKYPVISHGKGPYLYDKSGRAYWDASGGALVASIGHGQEEVANVIAEQLSRVAYVNGTQFTSDCTEELAEILCQKAPGTGKRKAFFLNSGSEANEAAIKFARQLWYERGEPSRTKIIARSPGYHGNTLYALSASARGHYKKYFGPFLSEVVMVEAPYEYRCPVPYSQAADYYANQLEECILKEGAQSIVAFIFEPVIGSSAGASVPPPNYFEKISNVCRKYSILMIADEVMCGAGRSGKFFASEHFSLDPDIVTMGKGISGGYTALSAVLVRSDHVEEILRGSGSFLHAQTYMQAPALTAAGLAVMKFYTQHKVLENVQKLSANFLSELKKLENLPNVGHVAGIGFMAGVEFVEDKANKKPFGRDKKFVEQLVLKAQMDLQPKGIILWPNVGQADGVNGDLFMLGPPLNSTQEQLDELLGLLQKLLSP